MTTITCDCKVCNGKSAQINGDATYKGKPMNRTMIHNFVRIAHSPLSRSASCTIKPV